MASGVRDFSVTFGARIAVLLVSLLIQSCLAWFLEPAGRGSYAVCVLFATLLTIVCVLGCDVAAIYFVASKRMTLSRAVANASVHGGFGCLLAIIVGLAVLQLPISFVEKASPTAFYLALVTIPLSFFSSLLTHLLGALRAFTLLAVLMILGTVSQLAFTVLFVVVLDWGVNGALLALIVNNGLITLGTIELHRRRYGLGATRPSVADLGQMLSYGARYYVGKISNQMNLHVGAVILAFFATREEIGLFAVATVMAGKVQMIPDTLTTVLMPRVAGDVKGRADLVAQCARVVAVVCGAVLAVLAVLAVPLVSVLFSSAFLEAAPLIRILAIGILVRSATKLFVPYLVGTDRPGVASVAVAVSVVANAAALYALYPVLGLSGAAWAMTIGYGVGAMILLASFVRISGMGVGQVWRFRRSDWAMVGQAVQGVRARLMPVANGEV